MPALPRTLTFQASLRQAWGPLATAVFFLGLAGWMTRLRPPGADLPWWTGSVWLDWLLCGGWAGYNLWLAADRGTTRLCVRLQSDAVIIEEASCLRRRRLEVRAEDQAELISDRSTEGSGWYFLLTKPRRFYFGQQLAVDEHYHLLRELAPALEKLK